MDGDMDTDSKSQKQESGIGSPAFDLMQDRIRDLRESTDFVSTLFESLTEYAIIAADFDGNVIAYNEGARQMYGYAPEEIIGRENIEIFFPKEFIEAGELQRFIAELIGKGRYSYEGEKVRKTGEGFPAQVLFTLTRTKNGKVVGFVEIVEDLTERKRAEELKAQAQAERIEQMERELRSLDQLSRPPTTAVTAELFDMAPLSASLPDTFEELVVRYGELLDQALEQRAYKVDHDISGSLRTLAEQMGLLKAGPRDVVKLHSTALQRKTSDVPSAKARALRKVGYWSSNSWAISHRSIALMLLA
jgi:PAS domain S-box-containing protein